MKKLFGFMVALSLCMIGSVFSATLNVPGDHGTIQAAVNAANSGDVVALQANASISSQITITTNGVTLDGNGYTITANFVKTSNSNNSALGVQADNITITDVILDGVNPVVNQLHGINFYEASNGNVTGVTAKNFRTGIAFNSSDGSISNVNTEGNIWHGINVDTRTSQVASVTIAGTNTHNESSSTIPHIWVDDRSDGTTVNDLNNKYVSFDVGAGRAYFVDITKPTATFLTPVVNQVFTGVSVPVTLDVTDDIQIKSVVINIKNASGGHLGTCYNNTSVGAPTLTANCVVNISAYADGKYELRAGVLDMKDNRLTTSTFFFVDKSKPTVSITTPTNGAAVKGAFVVTGNANDAISGIEKVLYTVTKIDAIGGSFVANVSDGMTNGTGVWNFSISGLTDGFYRLKVQAFDNGGNWRYAYHDVQVDTTKPVTIVDSPTDGSSFDADFTINVNSTDTGSAIAKVVANLYGPSGLLGPCTNQTIDPTLASVDFTCDVDVDALADAAYYVKTNAVDAAGNLSNTVTWNFTVVRAIEPVCGNSEIEEGEQCDDGNITNEDGCSATCQTEEDMGGGGGDEECIATTEICDEIDNDCNELIDDGISCGGDGDGDGDVCTETSAPSVISVPATTSTTTPVNAGTVSIGDILTISADTDDMRSAGANDPETTNREGNANGLDGFPLFGAFKYGSLVGRINGGDWFFVGTTYSATVVEAGILELAYWDSTYDDNSGEVSATITIETEVACVCGDGSINNEEQCDDGNEVNDDSCTNACTNPVCGDYIVQEGEECENSMMYDGEKKTMGYCNASCEWVIEEETYCGNEVVEEGEECDDGNETDTDACSNECTSNGGGGGQASSIGGGSSVGPSSLLETGPEEEAEATEDTAGTPLSDAVDQVDSSTISACNEDDYILSRLEKLSKQENTIVYDVPAEYATVLGGKLIRSSSQLLAKLRGEKDAEKRNDIIRAFVCKIEIIKEARGLRHKNIGANSGGDKIDYMLQYLQDLAILQFVK